MSEDNDLLRTILRNQRYIMLALSNVVRETTTVGCDYHANNLNGQVQEMEKAFKWIARPSERIS